MAVSPQAVKTIYDSGAKVAAAIQRLADTSVMIGVPKDGTARREAGITNAVLAYIHENGEPSHNIPARPFLKPGIKAVQSQIAQLFKRAGALALKGDDDGVLKLFHAAGIVASQSAKRMITQGLSPPLKPATILARLRKTQSGRRRLKKMRGTGVDVGAWGATNMKPLLDTGQLRNAITYTIRRKDKDIAVGPTDGGT